LRRKSLAPSASDRSFVSASSAEVITITGMCLSALFSQMPDSTSNPLMFGMSMSSSSTSGRSRNIRASASEEFDVDTNRR